MAILRNVTVQWHDDVWSELGVRVSIDEEWNSIEDVDDEEIFFYFLNEEEYEQAKQPDPNGFEFSIIAEEG